MLRVPLLAVPALAAALAAAGCSGGGAGAAGDGGAAKHLEPSAIPVAATYLRLVHRHECAAAARLVDQDDGVCLADLESDLERGGAIWTVGRGRIHRDCPNVPSELQAVKGYECVRFDAITRDCGATFKGRPERSAAGYVEDVFMRRPGGDWRVVMVSGPSQTFDVPGAARGPCTDAEIARLRATVEFAARPGSGVLVSPSPYLGRWALGPARNYVRALLSHRCGRLGGGSTETGLACRRQADGDRAAHIRAWTVRTGLLRRGCEMTEGAGAVEGGVFDCVEIPASARGCLAGEAVRVANLTRVFLDTRGGIEQSSTAELEHSPLGRSC